MTPYEAGYTTLVKTALSTFDDRPTAGDYALAAAETGIAASLLPTAYHRVAGTGFLGDIGSYLRRNPARAMSGGALAALSAGLGVDAAHRAGLIKRNEPSLSDWF